MTDLATPASGGAAPAGPAGPAGASPAPRPPAIPGPLDVLRAAWRRLRRMSTALALLFAVAAAAIVGTFVPQEGVSPAVGDWRSGAAGPGAGAARVMDALDLFGIFSSWWFLALVVLLFTSLTGCLLPRYRAFARVVRRPPAGGRNLGRLAERHELTTAAGVEDALAAARRVLFSRRLRRYRVRMLSAGESPTGHAQLAAERGHWREGGSLCFHTAFYVLLLGAVIGQSFGFTGQVNLVEGQTKTDARLTYQSSTVGRFFALDDHPGFALTLDDHDVSYYDDGGEGAVRTPTVRAYRSEISLTDPGGGVTVAQTRVNHPVRHDGMTIYQARSGYAAHLVLREKATGEPVADTVVPLGAAAGLPNTWSGQEKLSLGGRFQSEDGGTAELPQMALDMLLFPSAPTVVETAAGPTPVGSSPELGEPLLLGSLYLGDLGLEQARPLSAIREAWTPDQRVDDVDLAVGESVDVVGGLYTLELTGVDQWSGFQVSHQPGRLLLLAGAVLVLVGLVPSLYAYRRRIWVDVRSSDDGSEGSTVVLAGVALQRQQVFAEELDFLHHALAGALPAAPPERLTT